MRHLWSSLLLLAALLLFPGIALAQETEDYSEAADIECAEELLPALADANAGSDARFLTGRLLVMSGHVPETYGAADVRRLGPDETVLEYSTPEDAEAAFAKLETKYECYPDEILTIEESEVRSGESVDLSMGMSAIKGTPLGQDVTVAVLDTGIDPGDPLFAKAGEQGGRISAASYDFISDSAKLTDGDKTTTHKGHGTLVAGTVAERTPDNVEIMSLRIQSGGDSSSAKMSTLLLIGSAMHHALANGADVINMSFDLNPVSGSSSALNYLDNIIEDAWEQGVPCCVAAGNDGHAITESDYPACVSAAVTVGSVNGSGGLSDFSNYGRALDFTAPGELDQERSGTSFSAPGISACFACLRGSTPGASADELYEKLRKLCTDPGDTGWDEHYGWGIPDLTALHVNPAHHYVKTITRAATCTQTGTAQYRCSDAGCGDSYVETIPATGHIWEASTENGKLVFHCKSRNCSAVIKDRDLGGELTGGFSWRVEKAGVNTSDTPVAHLLIGGSGSLPELDTYPWEGCSDYITQIILQDTITSIPSGAFREMKFLGSVAHTDELTDGTVREGLPEGLVSIGGNAFASCSALKQLLIGKNVATIGDGAFAGCLRLTRITVHGDNEAFAAAEGCLYNKDKTDLYFCANDTGAYADTVATIAPQAFCGQQVSHVEIGENVTAIGNRAFAGCGHLRTVSFIGTADRDIGAASFKDVNAEIYVPEGVSGAWTGQNYGGSLRWHETTLNETSVTVQLDQKPWTYSGQEIRPAVTVKTKEDTLLKEGKDYTLVYSGNEAPGTGEVKIIGTDNGWSGVITRTFEIRKAVFSFKKIQVPDTIYANQELIVTYDGVPIKDMHDLEVEYSSVPEGMFKLQKDEDANRLVITKAGEGTLIITAIPNEYYEGDVARGYPVTVLTCEGGRHSWDKGRVTRKASYKKPGVKTYTCENCGETKTAEIPQRKGAAVGTKYRKGALTYKVRSGSVLQVTASKNVKSVTIPASVTINRKSYKVTSIGAKAFYKKSKLKKIIIRSTKIKSVGKSAFLKLPSKALVKVPKSKLKTYRSMVRKAGFKGKNQKIKAL